MVKLTTDRSPEYLELQRIDLRYDELIMRADDSDNIIEMYNIQDEVDVLVNRMMDIIDTLAVN